MTEKSIKTLQDIAQLTPDEFQRFLPDFVVWHTYAQQAIKTGLLCNGINWTDDGEPGLSYISVTIDGEAVRFDLDKGAA
jgi:hypothetical protein